MKIKKFTLIVLCLIVSNLIYGQSQPNILFAFADDWGKYASCYAEQNENDAWQKIISTPNIDRIAKEGVLFKNAFVNAPSCTPSRSAILSGKYFYQTGQGAILQGAVWDSSIPTYPLLLEENGYHIGYTYKVWSPGTPRDAGYGGNRVKYELAGRSFNGFSQFVSRKVEAKEMNADQAKQILYDEVRGNFQSFLDKRPKDTPFCYWFGPTNTHRKWTMGSGKDLWGIDPDKLEGHIPPFLPDVDTVRTDFSDYLGEVMAFDAGFGVLLDVLEETGELNNTFIVVSGDHGFPGVTNGKCNLYDFGTNVALAVRYPKMVKGDRVVDDFVNLMDLAPTFLSVADVDVPKEMTGKSILPILKSKASGHIDSSRDYVITGRERHVAQAREGFLPYPQRALRTKDYLYIINFKPDRWPMGTPKSNDDKISADLLTNNTFVMAGDYDASPTKAWIVKHKKEEDNKKYYEYAFGKRPKEELYDLKKDPMQINNVTNNSGYESIRSKLNKQLLTELKRTNDPRVMGDGNTFEKMPYTTAFKGRVPFNGIIGTDR